MIQRIMMKHQEVTHKIIGCAREVHRKLGPGEQIGLRRVDFLVEK